MKKKIVYTIILCAGCATLFFSPCLIKTISGYHCPACGTRRAMVEALNGNFLDSILINPYGILVLIVAAIVAMGLSYDCISKTSTFLRLYRRLECFLIKKPVLLVIIILTLLNWIWNLHKFQI